MGCTGPEAPRSLVASVAAECLLVTEWTGAWALRATEGKRPEPEGQGPGLSWGEGGEGGGGPSKEEGPC